jgi:hypothetical protein
VVWGGRLAVLGMLATALGLAVAGASHGVLRRLLRAGQPEVIPVTLTGSTLDPAVIVLRPGPVRFLVRNAGPVALRFSVRGPAAVARTGELPPGGAARLDVRFAHPGTYTLVGGAPGGTGAPTGTLTVRP